MLKVDLHNHTTLCNHASGTIDEYIQRAIELQFDIYGFSEHAPMKDFDDGYRLTLQNFKEYEKLIQTAKQTYKDKIDILLGYEVDFIDTNYLVDKIIDNQNVDYLIGSVHYLGNWGFDNPQFISEYKNKDINKIWQDYFDAITAMVRSGYFDIVGHLDLIKVFNYLPTKDIKLIAKETIKAIKQQNMVVEINGAGYLKPTKEQYPSKQLLQMCLEYDIPITFSSDAHSIMQVGKKYDDIVTLAKDIGYTKAVYIKQKQKVFFKLD